MKLSIIVPMYNVEKYIQRCLSSIINNKGFLENCELIVVNDGTKDNSESIARKIIEGLPNTQIIVQENQGLSAARNTGLSRAIGEYVWFIDSDDWIEPDSLLTLFEELIGDYDIIQFGYNLAYDTISPKSIHRNDDISIGEEVLIKGTWEAPVQFSVFKRKLLTTNDLLFYKGIYHEDMEFTPRSLWYARNVKVVDKILYNYYQGNPNSIVNKPNIKKCYDLVFVSERTIHFADTVVNNILCKEALLNLAALELNSCLRKLNQYDKITKREFISKLKNNQLYLKKMKNCSLLKYKVMAYMLLVSIPLYVYLLRFSKKNKPKENII